jgi:hypothetical protein
MRAKVGDRVHLLHGEIRAYPEMTIVQIDEAAGKAQIRFVRTTREGYSYLFWRDLNDILVEDTDGNATPAL